MIDLHVHSTASDGTATPGELVDLACTLAMHAVALTDPDTVSGLDEFLAAAQGHPLRAIPGVEVAASWYGASLHLTGLFIDRTHRGLTGLLGEVRGAREVRNRRIVSILRHLGADICWEEVVASARGETLGRPHIAQALVKRGVCASAKEAFDRFLATGRPGCVPRYLPLPSETIRVIHEAGGVAVWSHPFGGRPRTPAQVRQVARHLKQVGLDALEVCYSEHTREQERFVRGLAGELSLLLCGGSDYHGGNSPGVLMGTGRGTLAVPDAWLGPLEHRAAAHREGAPR